MLTTTHTRLAAALVFAFATACSDSEPVAPSDTDVSIEDTNDGGGGDVGLDTDAPLSCPGIQTLCGAACVNLASDRLNCGVCGGVCDSTEECVDGACVCPDGLDRCGTACLDTNSDPDHCGGCGVDCGTDEDCIDGACALRCGDGLTACTGGCVDTESNDEHCGGCDQRCSAGDNQTASCVEGSCERECNLNWYDLDPDRGCEYFCAPDFPGADDVCDGEDNDCDGAIDTADTDYLPILCPLQAGVCHGATADCIDGELEVCDALLYADHAGDDPFDEVFETWCDGLDNDCSGRADEDCCTPSELPVPVPDARMPVGWNSYSEIITLPLRNAPFAAAVVVGFGRVGEEPRTFVSLLEFRDEGGHGVITQLVNQPSTVEFLVLDAVWNDGVVLFTRSGAASPLKRTRYDTSGDELDSTSFSALYDDIGEIDEVRARVLPDGSEIWLIAASELGDISTQFYVAEWDDGFVRRSTTLTGGVVNGRLLDLVRIGRSTISCIRQPGLERELSCVAVDDTLTRTRSTDIDGALPLFRQARFVKLGTGDHLMYLPTTSGTGIVELRISETGTVTSTLTPFATIQRVALTGVLPNGDGVLVTGREDPGAVGVTIVSVPDRAGRVLGSYAGRGSFPAGFVYSDEALYIAVEAEGSVGDATFYRTYAFRLSQDGAALCIDIDE